MKLWVERAQYHNHKRMVGINQEKRYGIRFRKYFHYFIFIKIEV